MKIQFEVNYNSLNNSFKGRVIKKNDIPYIVDSVAGKIHFNKENAFKCVRLYDKNGMRINVEFYRQKGYLDKIELKSLFLNTIICSIEESKLITEQYNNNTIVLKIYYQYFHNVSPIKRVNSYLRYANQFNEGIHNEGTDNNLDNTQLDLVPYKVEPDYIDLNQYKIEIAENKIVDVKEKDTNLKVIFDSQLISEGIESKFSSFVSQSTMKVYTCLFSQNIVNIVHIHLNDTSESIAVDSFFLEKQDSISDFKKFEVDMTGKKLNYKFLFRDFKVKLI